MSRRTSPWIRSGRVRSIGVGHLGVVEAELPGLEARAAAMAFDTRPASVTPVVLDGPLARQQGVVELGGDGALCRGEVGVAAGQGQAVGIADRRAADDLDRQATGRRPGDG